MPTVSEFLMERLKTAGVKDVFGLPGDYVLNFYKKISESPNLRLINTADEAGAGFAANYYSRHQTPGCVVVTYNVGALKIVNPVACAYAERCPVVVIVGSPGIKERQEGIALHHMVRNFECQEEIFKNICCATAVLNDPVRAGYEIDRVFSAMNYHKQPIYIELPRDVADKPISYDVYTQGTASASFKTDEYNLSEGMQEVLGWLAESRKPVIMAGVQVSRYDLGYNLVKFAERCNIPIVSTLLSKSVVNEQHPLFLGVYVGSQSKEIVREAVENSDCLMIIGEEISDTTLNFMPAKFKPKNTIKCNVEGGLKVRSHSYEKIHFHDFCINLFKSEVAKKETNYICSHARGEFVPEKNKKMTVARFFDKINSILNDQTVVIADVGDCLFGASDLVVSKSTFLGTAFYASMGAAIPGALGTQIAKPNVRPIVLVGDGAFQMSCTELSTIVAQKLNPIIFVLNNHGYTTERFLLDGSFNDISEWQYEKITHMLGGEGAVVKTEEELEFVINKALISKDMFVINVVVDKADASSALRRMTDGLAKRV